MITTTIIIIIIIKKKNLDFRQKLCSDIFIEVTLLVTHFILAMLMHIFKCVYGACIEKNKLCMYNWGGSDCLNKGKML